MENNKLSNFVAIDYETSTSYRHSICQVAIVTVIGGKIVNKFSTNVRPPNNEYNQRNIAIHGIHPYHTKDSPSYDTVFLKHILPEIEKVRKLNDFNVPYMVAHNAGFDRSVFNKSLEYFKLNEIGVIEHGSASVWACTHQLYVKKGFESTKLNILCKHFSIPLQHHNALSDTLACTYLYLRHLIELNQILDKEADEWLEKQ